MRGRRVVTGAAAPRADDTDVVPTDREILARRITTVLLAVGTAIAIVALDDVRPFQDLRPGVGSEWK
jgi:hypothetical protein